MIRREELMRIQVTYSLIKSVLVSLFHTECANVCDPLEKLIKTREGRRQRDRFQPPQVSGCADVRGSESDVKPSNKQSERREVRHDHEDRNE